MSYLFFQPVAKRQIEFKIVLEKKVVYLFNYYNIGGVGCYKCILDIP